MFRARRRWWVNGVSRARHKEKWMKGFHIPSNTTARLWKYENLFFFFVELLRCEITNKTLIYIWFFRRVMISIKVSHERENGISKVFVEILFPFESRSAHERVLFICHRTFVLTNHFFDLFHIFFDQNYLIFRTMKVLLIITTWHIYRRSNSLYNRIVSIFKWKKINFRVCNYSRARAIYI